MEDHRIPPFPPCKNHTVNDMKNLNHGISQLHPRRCEWLSNYTDREVSGKHRGWDVCGSHCVPKPDVAFPSKLCRWIAIPLTCQPVLSGWASLFRQHQGNPPGSHRWAQIVKFHVAFHVFVWKMLTIELVTMGQMLVLLEDSVAKVPVHSPSTQTTHSKSVSASVTVSSTSSSSETSSFPLPLLLRSITFRRFLSILV